MANINRLEVTWSGLQGLPGMSVFYLSSGNTAVAAFGTFFGAIASYFPSNLAWSIPSSGDVIDDATGALTGEWSGTGAGVVTGTGGGAADYAAGVGLSIRWNTGTVVSGRRLRGRTFLTHLVASNYDNGGTIDTAVLTAVGNAATTLVLNAATVIWHRPVNGSGGSSHDVLSASVADQVSWLRTRKV